MHFQRVAHRDIKPSNILIDEGGHAKLSDFGVAVVVPATRQLPSTEVPSLRLPARTCACV